MKEYFKINPVARQYINHDKLFENEKVDSLMKKVADTAIEIFKRMNFDLAPKKDRKLSVVKVKLTDIFSSKKGLELLAKIKEYSEDNDLIDGNFSDAKDLYIKSLDVFIQAIKSVEEISQEKGRNFVQYSKENAEKLQGSLNEISDNLSKKVKNESLYNEETENLNEGFKLVGYKGRVRRLRDQITNLLSSAENKNSRNGYNKDWKREFLQLSQRLSALDTSRDGTGSKDKDNLSELEKMVGRSQTDFNKAILSATEKELKQIENDTELKDSYGDIVSLITKALDHFSTATSAQETAEKIISDKIDDRESKFNEEIFPIRIGDSDKDDKFEDSKFIENLQKGLMNGVSTIDSFLRGKGGADGKYGNATSAVIAALQKQSGNKNVNGEIDRELLNILLGSDFIESDDREKIINSLEVMKETSTNESKTYEKFLNKRILTVDDFFSLNESNKIRLDKSNLLDDINTYYEEYRIKAKGARSLEASKGSDSDFDAKSFSEEVAKAIRKTNKDISLEGDKFLNDAGGLKNKYSQKFLEAWKYAAENAEDGEVFFFFEGGIYYIHSGDINLNTPLNVCKWETRNGDDTSDYRKYIANYTDPNLFPTVGGIKRKDSFIVISKFFNKVLKNDDIKIRGVYKKVKEILEVEIPYIKFESVKGPIKKAFTTLIQETEADRGDADLGVGDFVGINNLLILLSGLFTHDGDKIITVASWIRENVLTNDVIERLNDEGYYSTYSASSHGPVLYLGESGIRMTIDIGGQNIRNYFGSALREVLGNVPETGKFLSINPRVKHTKNYVGLLLGHIKRMNAKYFDDVPQMKNTKCIEITDDILKK